MTNRTFIRILFFLISACVVVYLYFRFELSQINKLSNNFEILKESDEINGPVQNIKKRKGICYIIVDYDSIILRPSANYNYKNEYLIDNISLYDSVVKKSDTDSIFIIKENSGRRLEFIHNRSIEKIKEK